MKTLNTANNAHSTLYHYVNRVMHEFKPPYKMAIMGIAYGGEVEHIAQMLKTEKGESLGDIWGFDTFEGLHPKHVYEGGVEDMFEINCMDHWYQSRDWGTVEIGYDYQRNALDEQGLDNAHLVKGVVKPGVELPFKGMLHLAFLDMDILESMVYGYDIVVPRLRIGGYLCLHDVIPQDHIRRLYHHFNPIIKDKEHWKIEAYEKDKYMVVLKKLKHYDKT